VREAADACRAAGIKFGVYLSPWDRNSALYGTDAYNDYFKKQLRELLTQYGEIAEVWFDGACGEGPNGKRQQYDWAGFIGTVRELQPNAVMGPSGPDVRWVGNESGYARETEWCVAGVDAVLDPPTFRDWNEVFYFTNLNEPGRESQPGSLERLCQAKHLAYWPSEVDVSIRPGWFYHATEDLRVHSLERMVDMYYRSVGRNCNLLLNIPPDRRGLFHEHDVARLKEWRRTLDATFCTNLAAGRPAQASGAAPKHSAKHVTDGKPNTFWQAPAGATTGEIEVKLDGPTTFNRLRLEEMLTVGQRIEEFRLDAWHGDGWKEVCRGTTVGHQRLERFGDVTSDRVRVVVAKARACPTLRAVGLYRTPLGG
jgi:alpha-L-fucosidase